MGMPPETDFTKYIDDTVDDTKQKEKVNEAMLASKFGEKLPKEKE